jgi:site-specific DNA-cytosine methylase
MTRTREAEPTSRLRVLEFFSGIGGMHFSLALSGVPADVLAAFDINRIIV